MEEDIKILEEKIKIIESLCTDDCINKSTVIDPLKYALENLLTRYKEIEADNKRLKDKETEKFLKILDDTSKATLVQEIIKLRTQVKDSIPKSKVKEKIEEYINSILENLDEDRRWCDMELVDNLEGLKKELLREEYGKCNIK